jgi:hypothetical protein
MRVHCQKNAKFKHRRGDGIVNHFPLLCPHFCKEREALHLQSVSWGINRYSWSLMRYRFDFMSGARTWGINARFYTVNQLHDHTPQTVEYMQASWLTYDELCMTVMDVPIASLSVADD